MPESLLAQTFKQGLLSQGWEIVLLIKSYCFLYFSHVRSVVRCVMRDALAMIQSNERLSMDC